MVSKYHFPPKGTWSHWENDTVHVQNAEHTDAGNAVFSRVPDAGPGRSAAGEQAEDI